MAGMETWDKFQDIHKAVYGGPSTKKKRKKKDDMEKAVKATENQKTVIKPLLKAVTKREQGKNFPASDFAFVPDRNKPSTWKLRLTESPGGKPTAAQVGRAVAALGKGFRGRKVQLPAEARSRVVAKVRAAWRKANPGKPASEMPPVLRLRKSLESGDLAIIVDL